MPEKVLQNLRYCDGCRIGTPHEDHRLVFKDALNVTFFVRCLRCGRSREVLSLQQRVRILRQHIQQFS